MDTRDRHLHWEIFAYDGDDPRAEPMLTHAVAVTVIGYGSEADAIAGAQELIVRQHYHVQRVWECNVCFYQKNMTSFLAKAL